MSWCNQIYDADESGPFWKLSSQRALAHQAKASIPGKKINKERVIFILS